MNHDHQKPVADSAPETAGITLHEAGRYDFFSRLIGLGVNQGNSRMVVEMAGLKPGDRVLDVGCGTGNLTLTAKARVGESGSVTGIDASPEMVDRARKNALRTGLAVEFQVGLIEKIPYPAASFDAVINRLMIHHLPDYLKRQGLAEILRVLRPGGVLFIADFGAASNSLLGHLALVFSMHRRMLTGTIALVSLVKQAGFGDVTSGPTRSAFLAFVSARKPAPSRGGSMGTT